MLENQGFIMVVDDTPANLHLLQQMLHDTGYQVAAFPSGRLALAAASRKPPDLILLDINMPEMNGFEVCERLKADEKLKEIPVIFISALNDTNDKVRGFSVGGVDYVTKPFQFEEVQARVNTHLSLCTAHRELKKQNEILQENLDLREVVEQISRHDLKGPMTVILNIPEMLMAEKNLTPDQIELLGFLSLSAHRLMEMIHRSLDLYKMERGTYQPEMARVNLVKIVSEVFATLKSSAANKKIACKMLLEQQPVSQNDVVEVLGEEHLFFSIFSNLIKNAIEASPEGKEITVAFSASPQLSISIKNMGCIPSQIQHRFFEKYSTHGKEGGTGLGTFSARLMAKTLGGDIAFTSNETDGTNLVVTFASSTTCEEKQMLKEKVHENTCS
ncbi:MAG: hybrid sensor histidine kinase/response regulator [Candidatus Riflebacteria bacterium]|nr:hybrid sensor histidine kinase/response regulator [Candidatus Riflebacteria bacterium]